MEKKRLVRSEKLPLYMIISIVSSLNYAEEDLKERLNDVRNGNERLHRLNKSLNDLMLEIVDTIPQNQGKTLVGALKDYEVRIVPKATPITNRIVLEKEELRLLVDYAQEAKCMSCIMDSIECRKCKLENLMETLFPMDRYDTTLCPYNMATWEN